MCRNDILKDKTPEEVFSKIKPPVGNLSIFGCPLYIHVPKKKRKNMEPSGKKGGFLGYTKNFEAYKIYVPGQRKIEVSRDVTFHEEATFKKSECFSRNQKQFIQLHPLLKMKSHMIRGRNLVKGQVMSP